MALWSVLYNVTTTSDDLRLTNLADFDGNSLATYPSIAYRIKSTTVDVDNQFDVRYVVKVRHD